ncbi:hypothetical protein IAT38_004791 [Cryptococcus sp. DSM 104549]
MDANGLPIAFGKQANTLPPRPEQPKANKHENQGSSRGGSSGRGQRGTVGGGKRSRVRPDRKGNAPPKGGKDGGAEDEVKQAPPQPQAPLEGPADYSSRTNALNSGIKLIPCVPISDLTHHHPRTARPATKSSRDNEDQAGSETEGDRDEAEAAEVGAGVGAAESGEAVVEGTQLRSPAVFGKPASPKILGSA